RGERDLQRAQRQADELAAEQKQTQADVNSLDQAGAGRAEKAQQLAQRKDAMDAKVADLQKQLEELANQMRRDERDAARKLDEAAGSIRDKRIREMLRYSRNTLNGAASQYARGMEESLTNNLDALSKKIADASAAMGKQAKQDGVGRAGEKARDLVRGMESMDQRMREKGQRGSQGSQGAQGAQGSDGQTGGTNADGGSPRGGAWGGDGRNWGGYYGGYGYYNPDDI